MKQDKSDSDLTGHLGRIQDSHTLASKGLHEDLHVWICTGRES